VEKGGEDKEHPAIGNLAVQLKSYDFIRVRIGIQGDNPKKLPRSKYINQEFEIHENLKLIEIINDAEAAIRAITLGDIEEVIDKYKN
jgi:peptidyl-tRNA hydrolase, PTH1 family